MRKRGREFDDDDPDDEYQHYDVGDDIGEVDDGDESSLAYCPDCGAKIWDQADICPKCFSYLAGHTSRFPPRVAKRRGALRRAVVVALILAIALGAGGVAILYLRRAF